MKYKIAINGFGRIGRLTLRALLNADIKNLEVVALVVVVAIVVVVV